MTSSSVPATISHDEIDNRFTYHPPTNPLVRDAHDSIRAKYRELAHELVDALPPGREADLAVERLEESSMQCHAAIARNHEFFDSVNFTSD